MDVVAKKETWQMTPEEYLATQRVPGEQHTFQASADTLRRSPMPKQVLAMKVEAQGKTFHKAELETALLQGKPVPPEVLADYPDLAGHAARCGEHSRRTREKEDEQTMDNTERLADLKAKNQGLPCFACGKTTIPTLAEQDGETYDRGSLLCGHCGVMLLTPEGVDCTPDYHDE